MTDTNTRLAYNRVTDKLVGLHYVKKTLKLLFHKREYKYLHIR
jgi:hypothetical protein